MNSSINFRKISLFYKNLPIVTTAISSIIVPILLAFFGYLFQSEIQRRDIAANEYKLKIEQENNKMKIAQEYIKTAIDILSKQPINNDQNKTREWAVDIINYYSEVKINAETKKSLVENSLSLTNAFNNTLMLGFPGQIGDGFAFELEIKKDSQWVYEFGQSTNNNNILIEIDRNKEYRWRVKNYAKNTQQDWLYIAPTSYNYKMLR